MRIHLEIDEKLMRDALKASGLRTKRAAVELGLQTLLRIKRQEEIRQLRGKIEWVGDLEAMRTES